MESETETTQENLSPIEAIYTGECSSLSGQSTLTYAIGRHPEDQSLHLRIATNSGGGMFCDEWASGSAPMATQIPPLMATSNSPT